MTGAIASVWHRLRCTRLRDVMRGRLDSSLDWRGVITLANLPPELAASVQQVVSRSRLWRREKVDVASELVAHFQDGIEAGHTPADLLQSFGDPLAAAQLIRRAKRRNRSILWAAWHYGWMSLAGLFFLYVMAGLWMATRQPTVKVDYLADFNKSVQAIPENERAWPLYRDALLGMGVHQKSDWSSLETLDAKPGDANWKSLEKYLTTHADSIAKLREAAAKPKLGFVTTTSQVDFTDKDRELFGMKLTKEQIEHDRSLTPKDRWLISALLPDLKSLRDTGFLLAADALRAAAAGDGNTAFANIQSVLGVSKHCEETPFMVCILVADAIQKKARRAIQEILADYPKLWSDDQLRKLAHQLVAAQVDWRRGFQGERSCFYDSMQRIYTDNGNGDGNLALQVSRDQNLFQLLETVTNGGDATGSMFSSAGVAFFALPAANIAIGGRKEMIDTYDQITDKALARLVSPYWTWAGEPSLDADVQALKSGPLHGFRHFFVLLLTPSYDKFLNQVVASDGNRDGVFIGLGLELYHREHGKWPELLAELSPRYLPTLPVDPTSGKPLHYKIVNDRPIVYSVGVDGDDDSGRTAKNVRGESQPEYAEPRFYGKQDEAVRVSETDGDWILWNAAKTN
jgi:hypothetical protein